MADSDQRLVTPIPITSDAIEEELLADDTLEPLNVLLPGTPGTPGTPSGRPKGERRASRLSIFRRSLKPPPSPNLGENNTRSVFMRLSQRAQVNLRTWYNRGVKRKTEQEMLHDLEKSRLLYNEVAYGNAMVLALASTMMPNHGVQRVPVLFEQISVKVQRANHENGTQRAFEIFIEYGSGPSMIKWSVVRVPRDFFMMHGRMVQHHLAHRNAMKPPHLPRIRHFQNKNNSNTNNHGAAGNDPEAQADEELLREEGEVMSLLSDANDGQAIENREQEHTGRAVRGSTYEEGIQHYLERILHMSRFRADSNRLLTFLELSHMSIKLAPEYPYHGKEGNVIIRSRASEQGWRVRHWQPRDVFDMISRHTNKWMLVRDSYIVIVENIYSTNILDVFLVDPYFKIRHHSAPHGDVPGLAANPNPIGQQVIPEGFFLHIKNNSRSLKVATRGERESALWTASITHMSESSPWSKQHRFGSFSPVRNNVFGQWFVDGRDYMWVVSEALESARDTIFMLDWWLSPEIYLRRPPESNQHWRLDRILRRKAEAGVKIFIVVYRNVGTTIPIDSLWTKHSLLDLHPNIHVMRAPYQLSQQKAIFWAHHEKLCVIDNTIAFNGGVDLCFGRWDTSQHVIVDDAPKAFYDTNEQAQKRPFPTQMWPGKDYSNPRVKDFFALDKPFEDMYDRQVVPRMPWHDIHQMVVGQPARDIARHFVQRWNYVIRQKVPSRETPLLLPPPDFTAEELERLQLTGTCEYQVLRSSCDWSLGLKEHEQSIQNAYLKLIDSSEHFVYIENQFFITSTVVDGMVIENKIGTALVQRIIRAHERGEKWRAVIVIPLMPGFEAQVDSAEASSVRLICRCQFNSISRGANSIFYRLERVGIHPENYITFCSLRKWGKIGPEKRITTEQLYIHAKAMIVDDRVAIIGSANINERSMRGVRDSEIAVCVRDTQVVESTMAGKPFKAAKFAHTLRVRLMREHLGVDVDKLDIIEQRTERLEKAAAAARRASHSEPNASDNIDPSDDRFPYWLYPELHSFNYFAGTDVNKGLRDHKKISVDHRVQNSAHRADVDGLGEDHYRERQNLGINWAETIRPPPNPEDVKKADEIEERIFREFAPTDALSFKRLFYRLWTDQPLSEVPVTTLDVPIVDEDGNVSGNDPIPIDPWSFDDPIADGFMLNKWLAVAERNTLIFRKVFRCQPDNDVSTWKDYKKYTAHMEAFMQKQAEEGGPEAMGTKQKRPERVDQHVLTGTVERTNPESYKYQLDHELDEAEKNPDKPEFKYQKRATSSSAAGTPGLPSLSHLLKKEHGFNPANSEFPNGLPKSDMPQLQGLRIDGLPAEPGEAHHSHRESTPTPRVHKDAKTDDEHSASLSSSNDVSEGSHGTSNTESYGSAGELPKRPAANRRWNHFDQVYSASTAEEILNGVTGHLVIFPTEWLSRELESGNWNFQMDLVVPLDIYN